jgi:hypothetical protein
MIKKLTATIWILIIILGITFPALTAGGLSSNWGEIVFDGLEAGKTYKLNQLTQAKFKIKNNFENPVHIKIEIINPAGEELKPGYEALPDIAWVVLEKTELKINSGKEAIINLTVNIPPTAQAKTKKYQFWVWTRTIGQAVGVGLKSRVLVSVKG